MRSLRLLVPGLLFSTSSVFLSFGPAWAASTAVPAGHLAFITPRGALDVVAVLSDGTTTDPVQIAPVTTVAAPLNVVVTDLVVSADGSWLAWAEEVFKPDPTYGKVEVRQRIAVRNMTTGATTAINSDAAPLGFSGSQLVVEGARTARLVTNPSPHFVSLHEGNAFPVATYAGGVVDVRSKSTGRGDLDTEQLRLTSFSGHHTVLHTYQVGLDYRAVTANIDAVSPDGKELLVERGNHQDFDGLGPSSLFDEYAMSGGHERRELGEYGTKAAKWRLVDATFVGTQDTPWMALHSGYTKVANNDVVVRGVVVSFTGGRWKLQARDAIAVAGNPDGYVVVQPGTWREVKNAPDGEYDAVPSAPAVLDGPGGTHDLTSVEGSQLAWVGGALPTATPSAHAAVAGVVGSLAYVAAAGQGAAGQVDVVQVGADGSTSTPQQIGPVSTGHGRLTISNLTASSDGKWLAWQEFSPRTGFTAVVLDDMTSGATTVVPKADGDFIGFAGDTLVVLDRNAKPAAVDLSPSPHLVEVPHANYPEGVYPQGIVDRVTTEKRGVLAASTVRLSALAGGHSVLHVYPKPTVQPTGAEVVTSPDGDYVLIQVGNPRADAGLGSSVGYDEFSLSDPHAGRPLGRYGTASEGWQMGRATFVGPRRQVWTTVERTRSNGTTQSALIAREAGGWRRVAANVIVALGHADGYVVYQPGTWKTLPDTASDVPTAVPTTSAVLANGGAMYSLGLTGTEFAWVVGGA